MKADYASSQIHCKDANGDTVIVAVKRLSTGDGFVSVTQFKGKDLQWQREVELDKLIALVSRETSETCEGCYHYGESQCIAEHRDGVVSPGDDACSKFTEEEPK